MRQVITPSATVQCDGVPSSLVQPVLSRPLNNTTASDGALPGPPGSTTGGCGPISLWAYAMPAARTNTANTHSFFIFTSPWLFLRRRFRALRNTVCASWRQPSYAYPVASDALVSLFPSRAAPAAREGAAPGSSRRAKAWKRLNRPWSLPSQNR